MEQLSHENLPQSSKVPPEQASSEPLDQTKIDRISEQVLMLKKTIRDQNIKGAQAVLFEYGNKKLKLTYNPVLDEFGCYIENIDPQKKHQRENETTIIYNAVRIYLQKLADANKSPINYSFRTKYPSMRDWAETRGQQLFHWTEDYLVQKKDGKTVYVFRAVIQPNLQN